jgi:hypothetical protein
MAAARRRIFRSVEAVGLDFVHSKWTGESIVAVVVSTQSRVRHIMRKQSFSLRFLLKRMGLPRQARDQHSNIGKALKKRDAFPQVISGNRFEWGMVVQVRKRTSCCQKYQQNTKQ